MGIVAQATQQTEAEKVQKLEAEQKAKLSAQNAEQHVSQMQSAMIAEVDRIRRDAEASQNVASEQVRTIVGLSDASVTNLFRQGKVEQLVKEKAEAERRSEQRSMRSSAVSANSTYDISTPRTAPRKEYEKLGPNYFQNLWTLPSAAANVFAPTATMTAPARMQGPQTEHKPSPVPCAEPRRRRHLNQQPLRPLGLKPRKPEQV